MEKLNKKYECFSGTGWPNLTWIKGHWTGCCYCKYLLVCVFSVSPVGFVLRAGVWQVPSSVLSLLFLYLCVSTVLVYSVVINLVTFYFSYALLLSLVLTTWCSAPILAVAVTWRVVIFFSFCTFNSHSGVIFHDFVIALTLFVGRQEGHPACKVSSICPQQFCLVVCDPTTQPGVTSEKKVGYKTKANSCACIFSFC